MGSYGVLDAVDVVAVHGFPLDWNHWQIREWPAKLDEIRASIQSYHDYLASGNQLLGR